LKIGKIRKATSVVVKRSADFLGQEFPLDGWVIQRRLQRLLFG